MQTLVGPNLLSKVVAESSVTEMITSDMSLSPYDKEDLSGIYSLLDSIQSIYHS
jgi:hypothetical protein